MTIAFPETPARRRMVRPLRQHVDLKFVRRGETETPDADPALYDVSGRAASAGARPGRLLNVRA